MADRPLTEERYTRTRAASQHRCCDEWPECSHVLWAYEADAYEGERDAARAEAATLRAALAEAIDFAEEGWNYGHYGHYAGYYLRTIAKLRAVLARGGEDA